jgi:putative exosortase-associated protein (TIGR04073 family)
MTMKTRSLGRWWMIAGVLTALIVVLPQDLPAQDAGAKFTRGAANTTLGILEIPGCVKDMTQKHGPWMGYTVGFLKGLVMVPVRTLVGVYETATFCIPAPARYDRVLVPETPLHYFNEQWSERQEAAPVVPPSQHMNPPPIGPAPAPQPVR